MSATNDRLEVLIGKFLDGEISPSEQRVLDRALERDGQARDLLDQFRTLHECSREMIVTEVLEPGADSGDVFERAWQRNKKPSWRRIVIADGHLRFAAGLAAGLILGVFLHFALVRNAGTPDGRAREPVAGHVSVDARLRANGEAMPSFRLPYSDRVTRKVDWVSFTDDAGHQWLVEGIREGLARPAAYHGDL